MTQPAQAEESLRNAMDGVGTALTRIDGSGQQLVDEINSALRVAAFVSPLAAVVFSRKASGALEGLFQQIEELKKSCQEFVEAGVPVFSLIRAGFGWNESVLPGLSGMTSTARDIRPNGLHAWRGSAASAYIHKRIGQSVALGGTADVVKETGQWLIDVAALNAKFLVDLTTPLIELADSIIRIAIEIATVVGVLEAIGSAAEAVAEAATAILTIAQDAARYTADSISALGKVKAVLNDNKVYPGGTWPQAVQR